MEADPVRRLREICLREPRRTVAVAESITGGHLQALLTSVSGASDFFLGGITAYTTDQKVRHLGVDRAMAARCDAVSALIAREMACGACRLFGSDIGAATTGYAEPAPSALEPFAHWAIVERRLHTFDVLAEGEIRCPGELRIDVQRHVAATVLAELVARLDRHPPGGATLAI